MGYANVTTIQILTHLYTTYGKITPQDLDENHNRMKAPFDPSQPIEELFQQIEDAQELATAADEPFTDSQLVSSAYNNVFQTGLFADACREWRRKAAADKSWANFQVAFALAHQEYHESLLTAQSAGYASNVIEINHTNETLDALANLAAAHASDRTTMSDISSLNSHLSSKLTATEARLETALADIAELKANKPNNNYRNRSPRTSNNSQSTNTTATTYSSVASTIRRYNNNNYCWTHGYHIHDSHTSATCKWTKEGHKKDATRANIMGGATIGKDLVG